MRTPCVGAAASPVRAWAAGSRALPPPPSLSVAYPCSICIAAADQLRYLYGATASDGDAERFDAHSPLTVRVRERGSYFFRRVGVAEASLKALLRAIATHIPVRVKDLGINNDLPTGPGGQSFFPEGHSIYAVYTVPDKHLVHDDAAVALLRTGGDLEVIFV